MSIKIPKTVKKQAHEKLVAAPINPLDESVPHGHNGHISHNGLVSDNSHITKISNTVVRVAREKLSDDAAIKSALEKLAADPLIPMEEDKPRGHIFIAATKLFAEFGFKGTSTRAIASEAGVKQVMVHYYFGSKEQLYEAVLKKEGMIMLAVIFGAESESKSPAEMLIEVPIRLMTVLHDNPKWASLLRREMADGCVHLRKALRDVSSNGPLGANLHFYDAYKTAVANGTARELPVEAVRECLLAIGYSAMYLAPLVSMINERDIHDPVVWEEWKITLSTILKQGLLTAKMDWEVT